MQATPLAATVDSNTSGTAPSRSQSEPRRGPVEARLQATPIPQPVAPPESPPAARPRPEPGPATSDPPPTSGQKAGSIPHTHQLHETDGEVDNQHHLLRRHLNREQQKLHNTRMRSKIASYNSERQKEHNKLTIEKHLNAHLRISYTSMFNIWKDSFNAPQYNH